PTRRCAATSPTPATCSSTSIASPAPTSPPATGARPAPSPAPTTSSRPASTTSPSRRRSGGSVPTSTATGSWRSSTCRPAARWARRTSICSSCGWSTVRSARSAPSRSCVPGGRPGPRGRGPRRVARGRCERGRTARAHPVCFAAGSFRRDRGRAHTGELDAAAPSSVHAPEGPGAAMSESRRPSSGGGNRRAAGVRRTPSGKSAKGGAGKGSSRSGSSKSTGSAKGTSRTASKGTSGTRTGAAATTSAASASSAKRPTSRTSVSARHAGAAPKGAGTGRGKKVAATNFLNYPRAGRKNPWRWIPSLRMIVGAMALFVLAGLGFAVWLYNDTEVPEPSDFALAQTSRVYFADGETEMGQFSEINRTELPADEIPDNIKQAVVASEDSSFYENRGVSPRGIVRAFVNNLQGGARQGGSTITMQYVERYYTGTETSYVGKAKEAIMALKIDQELSKDEILSRYLNTIYFGRGAYGVQEASQAYFGKDAKDLTEAEAALLVAVIPGPSAYDPANNPEKAVQLWDRVITRQVGQGQMTPAEADAIEFPETIDPKSENSLGGTKGYLLSQVRKELLAQGFTEDEINTGGFTIVSTIDPKVQE